LQTLSPEGADDWNWITFGIFGHAFSVVHLTLFFLHFITI